MVATAGVSGHADREGCAGAPRSAKLCAVLGRALALKGCLNRELGHLLASPRRITEGGCGYVAITFDDGPDPVFTSAILDVLERREVPATFFLIGDRARQYPSVVRRIHSAGHGIGSHTRSHPDMWTISAREVVSQYCDGRAMVEDIVGAQVPLVRPPKGWLGLVSGMALRSNRFIPVLWSCSGYDWLPAATVESITARLGILRGGEIVLLHDAIACPEDPSVHDRTATVAALEKLITSAQEAGLVFAKLGP